MCEVPEALPGRQGVLPALSRALLLEPGELGKSRLPRPHNSSAFRNNRILAISLSGYFLEVTYGINTRWGQSFPSSVPETAAPQNRTYDKAREHPG